MVQDSVSNVTISVDNKRLDIRLRSGSEIRSFLNAAYSAIYLDITGLSHHVWAPILRGIRSLEISSYCVYVEPGDYRFSDSPTEATMFDYRILSLGVMSDTLRPTVHSRFIICFLRFHEGYRQVF